MSSLAASFLRRIGLRISNPSKTQDWRKRYSVGRWTYGEPQVLSWEDGTTLSVGAFCSIAAGVQIFLGGNHRTEFVSTYPFAEVWKRPEWSRGSVSKGDVAIGNDVWLASRCVVMSGVTIGDGAVVGACSVVTKNVPPYAIVAGNPARIVRKRFSEEQIGDLLRIQWWNWDDRQIESAMPWLMSGDVDGLVSFAEKSFPGIVGSGACESCE